MYKNIFENFVAYLLLPLSLLNKEQGVQVSDTTKAK
jgi:hypothetical protein